MFLHILAWAGGQLRIEEEERACLRLNKQPSLPSNRTAQFRVKDLIDSRRKRSFVHSESSLRTCAGIWTVWPRKWPLWKERKHRSRLVMRRIRTASEG